MPSYLVCGAELRSDVALASLQSAPETLGASAALSLLRSSEPLGEPSRWLFTEYLGSSEEWRAVGVHARGYLVRLFGFADFLLERGTSTARVHALPQVSDEVIEPLFLEQALPLWWSLLGRTCLHASAVGWGEGANARAIAFSGRSGSGKSTLATSFAAARLTTPAAKPVLRSAAARDVGLLADDCLVVEIAGDRLLAHPGHRAVRLLGDSAEALLATATPGTTSLDGNKRRVDLPAIERAMPLDRIYMVEPTDGAPQAVAMTPRDALARLAANFFRVDPEDRARLAGELAALEEVTARTRIVRLCVPRRFAALAAVHAVIEADLASG